MITNTSSSSSFHLFHVQLKSAGQDPSNYSCFLHEQLLKTSSVFFFLDFLQTKYFVLSRCWWCLGKPHSCCFLFLKACICCWFLLLLVTTADLSNSLQDFNFTFRLDICRLLNAIIRRWRWGWCGFGEKWKGWQGW